ncbi:sugar phosphate isomerase/epimerase family protein [Micropruina sp.]|uniref:sugar phosphate isomerase/epimerase family protein n=1 Tax=Micropruina sp. TaxID=2737536 RepID=UPI0039E536E6
MVLTGPSSSMGVWALKKCISTVSLGGTLVEKIEAIAAAGFDGIELFDADLRGSGLSAGEVARRCRDVGLDIECYQPFRRAEGVPDEEFADVIARFTAELTVMRGLGTDTIVIVSNTDPDAIADPDHSAAQLAALGAIAADHGMGIMFEALSWGTQISRVAHAWDVLQRAGYPRQSLVLDTFHLLALDDDARDVAALPPDALGLVQLADAPALTMDLIQWSRNHRCFPGEGDLDVTDATRAALGAGFDGAVSLEIFNPRYRELPPRQIAQRGADALNDLLARCECTAWDRPLSLTA